MPPRCVHEGQGVFGKGHVFWMGASEGDQELRCSQISLTTCVPQKQKQYWSTTEKQPSAALKSV